MSWSWGERERESDASDQRGLSACGYLRSREAGLGSAAHATAAGPEASQRLVGRADALKSTW